MGGRAGRDGGSFADVDRWNRFFTKEWMTHICGVRGGGKLTLVTFDRALAGR